MQNEIADLRKKLVSSQFRLITVQHDNQLAYAGADLGLLQWWGCSSNVREKFWATPVFNLPNSYSIALVAGTLISAKPQASPQPVWSVVLQLVQN